MSRIGKKPIEIPSGVKVTLSGRDVAVESSSAKLFVTHRPEVSVAVDEQARTVTVERQSDDRVSKSMHGLTRSLIANMIEGVSKGFSIELEINGAGWNAQVQGRKLVLNVGYASPRVLEIADGLAVEVNANRVKVSGADKQKVGQLAASIRAQRPPEPYNLKGIKYSDEQITRKPGKQFVGGAG